MYKFDREHYYEEGDFALIVQSTVFRVHSVILRLASGFFKARFSGDWTNPSVLLLAQHDAIYDAEGNPDGIVRREVRECRYQMLEEEDSPEDMAALLSFVYPSFPRRVRWEGVVALWRMCDKYLADTALQEVRSFVEEHCAKFPLVAMMLADRAILHAEYRDEGAALPVPAQAGGDYSTEEDFRGMPGMLYHVRAQNSGNNLDVSGGVGAECAEEDGGYRQRVIWT
ncbi:hypothetical protein BC937DRAFT_90614 [Endogone sp. FLAS-F59071]|nr:hypothetical protein BC937DRAFT_90614 [Endogone sp. FLAS-F59071]|eukprot:RUS22026.1 hypothetical protein BC937DRAFT_90614 [Endogone sp. FLAS-F59071]